MSLQSYRAKRKFQETPEPQGTAATGKGPLRFVVQKHAASRLHYDLRLEVDGTLKSWAVPKGPPRTSQEKRLAIMVEDHPLEYLHFEGIIPKGNYGAGTMMVWDTGTYHAPGITNRQASERLIREGLQKGQFHVVLHGDKLKGEFILVHTRRPEQENGWLWFPKAESVPPWPAEDRSALSRRTMEEIASAAAPRKIVTPLPGIDLSDVPEGAMPRNVRPMLAMPADRPFDRADWIFEVKWDGYRAIAEVEKSRVRLYSRRNLGFDDRFAAIVDSLEHLGHEAVLDGEIVVLDKHGKPNFHMLQEYLHAPQGALVYQVFDLLYLDGYDLRKLPLLRRKQILTVLLEQLPNVKLSEHIHEHGVAFFEAVSANALEGIVAKDGRSRYQEGVRSHSWLKIKTHLRQEAVIGGFTEPKGSRAGLGSVVLGVYQGGDLVYIGHAGSGFSDRGLATLRTRLAALEQKTCPFKSRPKANAPVHWVRPELVCEVSFDSWTHDGHIRHPVFLGLRDDKDPATVTRESPLPAASVPADSPPEPAKPTATPKAVNPTNSGPNPRQTIDGHVVQLSNLTKVYWPEAGLTKGDLIRYYRDVAEFILPYLKDRPQSLHRHPNGVHGKSFFQKDVGRQPPPDWVQTVNLTSESDGKVTRALLCQDEATLVYLANLGCIELNPWNARVGTLDHADYALLDLDPEAITFGYVVEAAQEIRKVLEQAGATAVCKTSGKRGLHVYIPLGARYTHDQAKAFAELIAHIVHARLPATTSLVRHPRGRQGKVYLDYLQNGKGKTLAGPYSARPDPRATVSAPLKWAEVKRGLDPAKFTLRTMLKRLNTVGDLWQPVLGPGIDLADCLTRLESRGRSVRGHG